MLERRGSRTALVTTAGFRDVLELRRLRIPHMYDLFWRKPPPLVERRLRFEVNERVAADGTVVRPLDEAESRALAARLRATGVESVAVCFLHSYLYPEHEQRFGAILAEELPEANVSLSSEILREQREYERSATTVVNAYVRPLMASYLDRIRTGLDGIGLDGPLQIMQSSGGVMTADDAKAAAGVRARVRARRPASSPPAGWASSSAIDNLLAFDMGGTTAKASLIEDGAISRGREYEVGGSMSAGSRLIRGAGELLRIPTIDIAEVGAGGGSIAWLDPAGGLQVGPRSAGADPGPACYGRGGVEPTVTDANVLLGYMPAGTVADGQISISVEAAEAAVRRVAEPLGLTLLEAASGIHRIANARMTRALRSVSSEKGRDPRDFALIAYGGAGPMHAAGLAEDLGVRTVLVPEVAGLFSAVGLLFARPEFHEVRTCHLDVDAVDPGVVAALFAEMEARLAPALGGRRRSSGRGPPTSATAARAGRSRVGSPGRSTRGAGRAARALRGRARAASTACATSRARRSRSAPCGSPRSATSAATARSSSSTARADTNGASRADALGGDLDAPVRRVRRSATRRSRARCSSTSTTRPSSSRPAGRCGATPATGTLVLERDGDSMRSTRSRSRSSATRSPRSRTRWRRRSSAPRTRPSSATGWTSPPSSATRRAGRSRRR